MSGPVSPTDPTSLYEPAHYFLCGPASGSPAFMNYRLIVASDLTFPIVPTTNANLTGPITSVGNATSVAAQTGTGSTFVMQASPTLTTPDIGTPTAGVLTSCTGYAVQATASVFGVVKVDGTTITAASGVISTGTPDSCSISGASQSIPNTTPTAIAWNANTWDTNTLHSTSVNNSRITAKTAGKYHVSLNCAWGTNAVGIRNLTLYKNGSPLSAISSGNALAAASGGLVQTIAADVALAAADYLEVFGSQTSGAGLFITPEFFNASWFSP